jgi:hypothetical protein
MERAGPVCCAVKTAGSSDEPLRKGDEVLPILVVIVDALASGGATSKT